MLKFVLTKANTEFDYILKSTSNIMLKYILLIAAFAIFSACGNGDHEHHSEEHASPDDMEVTAAHAEYETSEEFRTQLTDAMQAYFDLSSALVQSDAGAASEASEHFGSQFEDVDGSMLEGEAKSLWDSHASTVKERSEAISGKSDVDEQRYEFEYLSESMIALVSGLGVNELVYEQTCPMVRGGSANWLASQENILNPYHGDRMLTCGSVVRVIE